LGWQDDKEVRGLGDAKAKWSLNRALAATRKTFEIKAEIQKEMKSMHRRVVLSFAILLTMAAVAMAAPAITVGSHPLPNTGPAQTDSIDINYDTLLSGGGGGLQGQTLYISIADEGNGGLGNADPGEPKIVSVDSSTGTVWAGNVNGPSYAAINDQVTSADQTTVTGTVSATGKVFTIVIARNGAANGSSWALRVFIGVPDLSGPYNSNWSGTSGTVDFQGSNGTFSYAPEPSSIVLGLFAAAGLGAVAIRRRRARA
jgi:hypothetical protein